MDHPESQDRKKLDRRQEKKKKNLAKIGKGKKEDYFDIYGPQARVEIHFPPEAKDTSLRTEEVNGLITWLLTDGMNPSWVFVKNKPLVSQVVFIIAPGLDSFTYQNYSNVFTNINSIFKDYTIGYNSISKLDQFHAMQNLLSIPISNKRKEHPTDVSNQMKKAFFLNKLFPNANINEKITKLHKNSSLSSNSICNLGSWTQHLKPDHLDMKENSTEGKNDNTIDEDKDESDNSQNGAGHKQVEIQNHLEIQIGNKHANDDSAFTTMCRTDLVQINPQEINTNSPLNDEKEHVLSETRFGRYSVSEKFIHSLSVVKTKKININVSDRKSTGRNQEINKIGVCDYFNETTMELNQDSIDNEKDTKQFDTCDEVDDDLPFHISRFLLKDDDVKRHNFPKLEVDAESKKCILPQGYVMTIPCPNGKTYHQLLSIDCEMCITEEGFELTRATVVDCLGNVLYDKLVRPKNQIRDYNTQYSGITASMLENVDTNLQDVQNDLLNLIYKETVLVGHSLECDMSALKLVHLRLIDTSVLFPHPRGSPYKSALRVLSDRILSRPIQQKDHGHDSVEDARACMDLVILKLHYGPGFGERSKINSQSLFTHLFEFKRVCSMIDRCRFLHQFASPSCSAIPAESDDDIIKKLQKEVNKPSVDFVCARFDSVYATLEEGARELNDVASRTAEIIAWMTCGNNPKTDRNLNKHSKIQNQKFPVPSKLLASFSKLDEFIGRLWNSLRRNSVLILATSHGDVPMMKKLQELKWKRLQSFNTGLPPWDEQSDDVLNEIKKRASSSLVFVNAKP